MEHKNMISVINEVMGTFGERKAFTDYGGESIRYADLYSRMRRNHDLFKAMEIKKGDKIALLGKNSTGWAVSYLSTVSFGAVIVPILVDFHPEDIHHILNHSASRILFTSESMFQKIDETSLKGIKLIVSFETGSILYAAEEGKNISKRWDPQKEFDGFQPFETQAEADDCAALVYTSGTSGFSKGVMIPHRSLMVNIAFSQENMPLSPGDNILSFLPLAHAYGCTIDLLFPFSKGCHITFLPTIPSPKILLKALAEVKPRLLNMVPLIIEKVYRKSIAPLLGKGSLKFLTSIPISREIIYGKIRKKLYESFGNNFLEVIVGGAPLNPDVEKFFKKLRFPLSVGYGMTECGPLISYASWDKHPEASVGKCIYYSEMKIDSEDPAHIPGEIMVKGPNVMLGYYRNDSATEEALDSEGWLHTGDLGLVDDEGYIYIKGRSKNMILGPSGQNIYPEEIESKLNSMPFVQESLVMSDSSGIYALVYPSYDEIDEKEYDAGDLEEFIRAKMEENRETANGVLPAYAKIRRIKLQPEPFEKTPTKKIKRYLYTK